MSVTSLNVSNLTTSSHFSGILILSFQRYLSKILDNSVLKFSKGTFSLHLIIRLLLIFSSTCSVVVFPLFENIKFHDFSFRSYGILTLPEANFFTSLGFDDITFC